MGGSNAVDAVDRLQGIMLFNWPIMLCCNAQHFDRLCLKNILLLHKNAYSVHWWILNAYCTVASQKTQCSPEESESAVHRRSSLKQRTLSLQQLMKAAEGRPWDIELPPPKYIDVLTRTWCLSQVIRELIFQTRSDCWYAWKGNSS